MWVCFRADQILVLVLGSFTLHAVSTCSQKQNVLNLFHASQVLVTLNFYSVCNGSETESAIHTYYELEFAEVEMLLERAPSEGK